MAEPQFETTKRTMPRPHPVVDCSDTPSRTKQSFKKEANINTIMKRYEQTGNLPEIAGRIPQYGDFSNVGTYQEALHQVEAGRQAFMALPAAIRDLVQNDPALFMAFVSDPENREQMIELGLIEPKAKPKAPEPEPEPEPEPPSE